MRGSRRRERSRAAKDAGPQVHRGVPTGGSRLDDVFFDSFSESRDGSAHGAEAFKASLNDSKRALFQLLSEAAEAFHSKGAPRLGASVHDAGPAGDTSKAQENNSEGESALPSGTAAGSRGATPAGGHGELVSPVWEILRATSPPPPRSPSARCAEAPEAPRSSGGASSEGPSSCRGSFDNEGGRAGPSSLPKGMLRRQGSWAGASIFGSPCSPRTANFSSSIGGGGAAFKTPREAFYQLLGLGERGPAPRWGHAAAAHEDRLYVFGGAGRGWLSDSYVYDSGKDAWSQIPAGREGPPATYGAAACSSRGRIFVFGGKQNQKHCRRLYSLDPATMRWTAHRDAAAAPPSCCGHSMTAVGRHGVFVFGGEGRRLSGAVHALDPETATWICVDTLGAVPAPRQSHTAVWDGSDSLLVFGGSAGGRLFGDLRVLSLSTGYWSEAGVAPGPPPRHSHAAAMLRANLMLVWGGCGERGAVLNDAWLLDTGDYTWHELRSIGTAPSGRYCHSCAVVGGRALLFGGTDAQQHFNALIGVDLDFGRQLGSIADSLSEISQHAAAAPADRSELLRVQLGNHLRQRHAQDASHVSRTRADIAERLFERERERAEQLAGELRHVRLMLKEEEEQRAGEKTGLRDALAALERERDQEAGRAKDLAAQLQAARDTVQRLRGEAVAVDAYKAMFARLAHERKALVDRVVELERASGAGTRVTCEPAARGEEGVEGQAVDGGEEQAAGRS